MAPRYVGSSQTSDWTRVPCIGRQILNPWTTREVPGYQSQGRGPGTRRRSLQFSSTRPGSLSPGGVLVPRAFKGSEEDESSFLQDQIDTRSNDLSSGWIAGGLEISRGIWDALMVMQVLTWVLMGGRVLQVMMQEVGSGRSGGEHVQLPLAGCKDKTHWDPLCQATNLFQWTHPWCWLWQSKNWASL